MKKIIVFVVLVVSLTLLPKTCNAEENYFYLDAPIEGIYTMMDTGNKIAANYVKPVRKRDNNEYVYCVTPGIAINPNGNYERIADNPWHNLNISQETYEKIQIISHFGYNYQNHTDLKWYAVTQYLIWQEVMPSGWSVYFTKTLRGAKTNDFDWMINEINSLVNDYYQNPSIDFNLIGNYKEDVTIYDNSNHLHNFTSNNPNIDINNDTLTIKPSNNSFDFTLDYITHNKKSNLYIFNNAQWVISIGSLPKRSITYHVEILKGKLNIIKKAANLNELDINYNPSLEHAKYQIFNDNYYAEYETNNNGTIDIDGLNIDSYYIREIKAPEGFNLDNTLYQVDITPNKTTILNVLDDIIIGTINIHKKYLDVDSHSYQDEQNATFGILNQNNDLLISKSTNENGYINFKLPLDKYLVTQISGINNYDKIKDEEIDLNEEVTVDLLYYNRPIAKTELSYNDFEEKAKPKNNIDEMFLEENHQEENIINIPPNNILELESNPQTIDNIKSNLRNLFGSIIIITTFFRKKLKKKKEIEEK